MRFAAVAGNLALVDDERAVDVNKASRGKFPKDPALLFENWDRLLDWAGGVDLDAGDPYDELTLGPPVPSPRQVFAVALNYKPHAQEAGYSPPEYPLVFTKFPSCITGPRETISLPPGNVDWEIELVVVIGRTAVSVPAERGWDFVAGVTVGQDLSERILQLAGRPAQFSLGKSYPGFGPIGPALVTLDELAQPDDLELCCELNNVQMQHARTSEMIFPVPVLIEFLSGICPLLPGDLIFTGTPAGIGNRRTPPQFLGAADELVSRIDGVGEMRHRFSC